MLELAELVTVSESDLLSPTVMLPKARLAGFGESCPAVDVFVFPPLLTPAQPARKMSPATSGNTLVTFFI
jgi:hypothetical protein